MNQIIADELHKWNVSTFEQYCNHMSKKDTYGDQLFLVLFATFFPVKLSLWQGARGAKAPQISQIKPNPELAQALVDPADPLPEVIIVYYNTGTSEDQTTNHYEATTTIGDGEEFHLHVQQDTPRQKRKRGCPNEQQLGADYTALLAALQEKNQQE